MTDDRIFFGLRNERHADDGTPITADHEYHSGDDRYSWCKACFREASSECRPMTREGSEDFHRIVMGLARPIRGGE